MVAPSKELRGIVMNDQQFVNAYIRILNDTVNDAMSKNLVMQAQLEVSKLAGNRVVELEAKIKELTNYSSDNNALQAQLNSLKVQLEQSNSQLNNKNTHVETFKKELVEARNMIKNMTTQHQDELQKLKNEHKDIIDGVAAESQEKINLLTAEIELLKTENSELKSRKKKKENKLALNTVNSSIIENNDLISVSDTF